MEFVTGLITIVAAATVALLVNDKFPGEELIIDGDGNS